MFGTANVDSYEYRRKLAWCWVLAGIVYAVVTVGCVFLARQAWQAEQGACQGYMFTIAMVDGSFLAYRNNKVPEGDERIHTAQLNRCVVADGGMQNGQHMVFIRIPPKIRGWQAAVYVGLMLVIFMAHMGYLYALRRRYAGPSRSRL